MLTTSRQGRDWLSLFASHRALPFGPMFVYPQPADMVALCQREKEVLFSLTTGEIAGAMRPPGF
jgi:hypothetical protein